MGKPVETSENLLSSPFLLTGEEEDVGGNGSRRRVSAGLLAVLRSQAAARMPRFSYFAPALDEETAPLLVVAVAPAPAAEPALRLLGLV